MTATTPIRDILLKLCRREDLTRAEAREAFMHVMSGEASEAQIGGLLVGLAAKGTTVEERRREGTFTIPASPKNVNVPFTGPPLPGPCTRPDIRLKTA